MLGLIGPFLELAKEGLKYVNTAKARAYLDELVNLEKQILEEEAKGYHSDDQLLVVIYRRLKIAAQAATAEARINAPQP